MTYPMRTCPVAILKIYAGDMCNIMIIREVANVILLELSATTALVNSFCAIAWLFLHLRLEWFPEVAANKGAQMASLGDAAFAAAVSASSFLHRTDVVLVR